VDSTLARVRYAALLIALALALAAAGCGDDDDGSDGGSGGGGSEAIREAVAKTEAAKTARMNYSMAFSGGAGERFGGMALVDFENDREHMTIQVEGQRLEMFTDGDEEYFRPGSSGRYRPFPKSAQSPVANNPTDSLQYLGTDVVDVRERGDGCYEGELDFDRILERAEEGLEGEIPDELRGERAPVSVCVDGQGRIRRYDVELTIQGETFTARTTVSDHGRVPALDPLGPAERPR
jgi:hypothetical protein